MTGNEITHGKGELCKLIGFKKNGKNCSCFSSLPPSSAKAVCFPNPLQTKSVEPQCWSPVYFAMWFPYSLTVGPLIGRLSCLQRPVRWGGGGGGGGGGGVVVNTLVHSATKSQTNAKHLSSTGHNS